MKKTRNLIILVVILVLLVAVYAIWQLSNNQEDVDTDSTSTTTQSSSSGGRLVDASVDEIDAISIQNEDYNLEFEKVRTEEEGTNSEGETVVEETEEWVLVNNQYDNVSPNKVKNLTESLINVNLRDTVDTDEDTDLTVFGIDEDSPTAILTKTDGETIELVLGNEATASGAGNYYVYNVNDDNLGVSTTVANYILGTELELLNNRIFNAIPQDITGFILNRDDFEYSTLFSGEPQYQNNDPASYYMTFWTINEPITWKGNDTNISRLVSELLNVSANEYYVLDEDTNLSSIGLDSPQYEITLQHSSQDPKTILIGSDTDNYTYASIKDSGLYFRFSSGALTSIGANMLSFYESFIALLNITTVDKLTFTGPDFEYVSNIYYPTPEERTSAQEEGFETPQNIAVFEGRDANITNDRNDNLFSRYYQSLIGLTIDGFAIGEEVELEDPVYTVVYERRGDNEDVKLDFVERDANSYYIFKNEEFTELYINDNQFTDDRHVDSPGVFFAIEQLTEAMDEQNSQYISEEEFEQMKVLVPVEEEEETTDTSSDSEEE